MSNSLKLFVAMDYNDSDVLFSSLHHLDKTDGDFGYKINLDMMLRYGYDIIHSVMKKTERPIFVDLKMWNGDRTMMKIVSDLDRLGVDYTNVHIKVGTNTLKRLTGMKKERIKILALIEMTHNDLKLSLGHVRYLVEEIKMSSCDGVILPPKHLENVKGIDILKVVPGIRPTWYKDDRHLEPVTPKKAKNYGADILVVGSPITKSENPTVALTKILEEIS